MRSRTASSTTSGRRLTPSSSPGSLPEYSALESVSTVGHRRVERWISWAIGLAAIVYGVQTVLAVLGDWDVRFSSPLFGAAILACELIPLAGVILTSPWPRIQHGFSLAFVLGYLVAELLWIGFVTDSGIGTDWIWLLCSVAAACAAQTLPRWLAVSYTVLISVLVGVARVCRVPAGEADYFRASMDFTFAVSLSLVIVLLVSLFRSSARSLDNAAELAVERYQADAMARAAEQERAEVDAFVHDTVLAALSSAVRAESPRQYDVSVRMATDAIRGLAGSIETENGDLGDVSLDALADALLRFAAESRIEITLTRVDTALMRIPGRVAEAMTLAATQALRNSVQHACADDPGGVTRSVLVSGSHDVAEVLITDNGEGFDPLAIDASRLGVRVSIIGRMASAGGRGRIDSAIGAGTRVSLTWEDTPTAEVFR